MEAGESGEGEKRKRTDSSGGSSDSELSEGWNFVDQLDVGNHDAPSSDGESVEVIEAEEESAEHAPEADEEAGAQEGASQLVSPPESQEVVGASQEEVGVGGGTVGAGGAEPPHEEMFDSSFCWFLFFATSAVLVSNLAFMAAENALDWNMEMNVESPSFLRDLPITQKPQPQDNLHWADNEEVTVDTLEDLSSSERIARSPDNLMDSTKYNRASKAVWQKQPLKIDNHEVGRYFKVLNDITGSAEAQNKFAQALLILDALHIGLKDLEEVVTENSKLHKVLEKQKDTLFNALSEVELGVSRSMEKLATSVLNKVQKLERRFENQWCSLEKSGYKDELKGLFYNCQDNDETAFEKSSKNTKHPDKAKGDFSEKNGHTNEKNDRYVNEKKDGHLNEKNARYLNEKNDKHWNGKNNRNSNGKNGQHFNDKNLNKNEKHKQAVVDSYQYEVDKDSTGKVFSKTNVEDKGNDDYYRLLKTGNYKDKRLNEQKRLNEGKQEKLSSADDDDKSDFKDKHNDYEGFYKGNNVNPDSKGKYLKKMNQNYVKTEEELIKDENKQSRKSPHETKYSKPNNGQLKNEGPQSKHDRLADKTVVEIVTRYLKMNCKNNLSKERFLNENDYESLKNGINGHVNILPEVFNQLYHKYCKTSGDSFKENKPSSDFKKFSQTVPVVKHRKLKADKPMIELVTKYLKDNCEKIRNGDKTSDSIYHALKDVINEKVMIPPDELNKMYERYCKYNADSFKWDKHSKNDQAKGDFASKNKERNFKDSLVIEDDKQYVKNVIEIRLTEESEEKEREDPNNLIKEKVILPTNKPRQWTFAYKSPPSTNKTSLSGDWFIKSGESRSKTRWANHRSDWWFDRASHRRNNPHPPNWFAGRRKNWFFRRAWARQQCRENPGDSWCHIADEETVTIPKTSSNLR